MRELRDSNREITTAHSKDSDKASKKKKSQLKLGIWKGFFFGLMYWH